MPLDMIDRIIAREGGAKVTNDPNDPGGLTKFGISKASHPDLDIANLTYEQAKDIYIQEYFVAPRIQMLPVSIQEPVLDCCVHSGPGVAIQMLQKVSGVVQDGVIGPNTVNAVSKVVPRDLFDAYQRERLLFLARQVYTDVRKVKYLVGWLSRVLGIVYTP